MTYQTYSMTYRPKEGYLVILERRSLIADGALAVTNWLCAKTNDRFQWLDRKAAEASERYTEVVSRMLVHRNAAFEIDPDYVRLAEALAAYHDEFDEALVEGQGASYGAVDPLHGLPGGYDWFDDPGDVVKPLTDV
jgi:hypothetical protein